MKIQQNVWEMTILEEFVWKVLKPGDIICGMNSCGVLVSMHWTAACR